MAWKWRLGLGHWRPRLVFRSKKCCSPHSYISKPYSFQPVCMEQHQAERYFASADSASQSASHHNYRCDEGQNIRITGSYLFLGPISNLKTTIHIRIEIHLYLQKSCTILFATFGWEFRIIFYSSISLDGFMGWHNYPLIFRCLVFE